MRWLDVEPSREVDPVLECLAFVARQADRPSSPVLLKAGLALSPEGRLPFHQIEPAILELADERAAVLLEVRDRDGLIYAPGLSEPIWVKLVEVEPAYAGRAVVIETDPTRERENERPWDQAKRR